MKKKYKKDIENRLGSAELPEFMNPEHKHRLLTVMKKQWSMFNNQHQSGKLLLPWWRRRVTVPIPAVLTILVVLTTSILLHAYFFSRFFEDAQQPMPWCVRQPVEETVQIRSNPHYYQKSH